LLTLCATLREPGSSVLLAISREFGKSVDWLLTGEAPSLHTKGAADGPGIRVRRAGSFVAGLEWILGFRLRGTTLCLDPCIPRNWPGFSICFRYHSPTYKIRVENPSRVSRGIALTELDGKLLGGWSIPLADDGAEHEIRIVLG
jgi:hypothetical protein